MGRISTVEIDRIELWKYSELVVFQKLPMYDENTTIHVSIKVKGKKIRQKEIGNVFIVELDDRLETISPNEVVILLHSDEGIVISYPDTIKILKQESSFSGLPILYTTILSEN